MLHFVQREAQKSSFTCVESNSLSVWQTHAFPAGFPFRLLLIVVRDPVSDTLPTRRTVHHFLRAGREAREEASQDHVTRVCSSCTGQEA